MPAIVARRAGEAPVRYVAGPVRGLAAAHNRGLLEVQTPLVAFTDDDVVADAALARGDRRRLRSTPGAACVTGRIVPLELATRAQRLLDALRRLRQGRARGRCSASATGAGRSVVPVRGGQARIGGEHGLLARGARAARRLRPGARRRHAGEGRRRPGGVLRGDPARAHAGLRARRRRRAPARSRVGRAAGPAVRLRRRADRVPDQVRPRSSAPAARRDPPASRGGRHVLARHAGRNARLPADFPPELLRAERRGMAAGPFAYIASRRSCAREA